MEFCNKQDNLSLVFSHKIMIQSTSIILNLNHNLIPNKMLISIIQEYSVVACRMNGVPQLDNVTNYELILILLACT